MTIFEPASRSSDAELIDRARTGDASAYADLHDRHRAAAVATARCLGGDSHDVDDLVNEAFARVLAALRRGGGPSVAFRPYLLTTLRRLAYDRSDRRRRETPTEDLTDGEPVLDLVDPLEAADDRQRVAEAFGTLPERWQAVLWHTEVEGLRPADVASVLGLRPNAVAALAYRAREGLRQAYLTSHAGHGATPACESAVREMGAYVRGGLSARADQRVREHLDVCTRCRSIHSELAEMGGAIRTVVAVAVVGAAGAPAVLDAIGAAAGTVPASVASASSAPTAPAPAGPSAIGSVAGWVGIGVAATALVVALAAVLAALTGVETSTRTAAADTPTASTATTRPAPSGGAGDPAPSVSTAPPAPATGAPATGVPSTGVPDSTDPPAAPVPDPTGPPAAPVPDTTDPPATPVPDTTDPSAAPVPGPSPVPPGSDPVAPVPEPPATVPVPDLPGTTVPISGPVSGPPPPSVPADDEPDVPVDPPDDPPLAPVALRVVVPVEPLVAGRRGLVALTVVNDGGMPAPEVVVRVRRAPPRSILALLGPGPGCAAQSATVVCRVSDVAPGDAHTWYLPVKPGLPAGRVEVEVTAEAPGVPGGEPTAPVVATLEIAAAPRGLTAPPPR